jgi:hypothetical protein
MAAKAPTAAAALAASKDSAAAATTIATTIDTTSAATTAVEVTDREEATMTVRHRHTTTDLGEIPEGGDSKDAAPMSAAAAAATNHRERKSCQKVENKNPNLKVHIVFFY